MFRLANILKHSDWKTNNLTPRMAHLVTQLCYSAAHGRHMLKNTLCSSGKKGITIGFIHEGENM